MKKISLFAIFSILVLFWVCSPDTKTDSVPKETHKEFDKTKIIILRPDSVNLDLLGFKGYQAFELSKKELYVIEDLFLESIISYNQATKRWLKTMKTNSIDTLDIGMYLIYPDEYRRQYLSLLNNDGDKIVWINCHCFTPNSEWKNRYEIRTVLDGGKCYFRVEINLTKGTYYNFHVNGSA